MPTYKIEVAVHYTGDLYVSADDEEHAIEIATEGFPTWLSTEEGELDYWGADLDVIESYDD